MEKTTSTRMQSLLLMYDMHTTFFKNVLDGISDEDAQNRLNTQANHIAWLTGSLVEQRYGIARDVGIDVKQKSNELFKDGKGIQDNVTYPSLKEFKKDWEIITPLARKAFIDVKDADLDVIIDFGGIKTPMLEMIAFTVYREANCIGQIALWRRLLGYEAMKYE